MPIPFRRLLLAGDRRAAVAVQTGLVFGFVLSPLIALVMDVAGASNYRTRLSMAADASVLVAATTTANELMSDGSSQQDNSSTLAQKKQEAKRHGSKQGEQHLLTMAQDLLGTTSVETKVDPTTSQAPVVNVTYDGSKVVATADVSAGYPTFFAPVWKLLCAACGDGTLKVHVTATAEAYTQPFVDIQLVLDTSESMNIAATTADIANLRTLTAQGAEGSCAFACHSNGGPGANYWQMVQDWNANPAAYMQANPKLPVFPTGPIKLRSGVLRDAVGTMVTAMQAQSANGRNRLGIATFGNEDRNTRDWTVQSPDGKAPITGWYKQIFGGTSGTVPLKGSAQVPALSASSDFAGAAAVLSTLDPPLSDRHDASTNLDSVVKAVAQAMPPSGDGSSPDQSRKFVFLVTDGMTDWEYPYGGNRVIAGINASACQDLKNKGITVAVLYTEYVRDDSMWWWWPSTNQSFSGLESGLQACASPNFYFKASTTDIAATLNTMLSTALAQGASLTF